MAILVDVSLSIDSADLLVGYSAGAKVYLYSCATKTGTYTDVASAAIEAGKEAYEFWDVAGSDATWYKSRVGNSGGSAFSDYSSAFQVNSQATYATLAGVKLRIGIGADDSEDDPLLKVIVAEVNAWMESPPASNGMGGLGCVVGPSKLTELTLDGRDARNAGQMLFVRIGILELASVEVNGTAITDWILRPLEHDRAPGWPAQQLWRTGGSFPTGFGDVVLIGPRDTPGFGFEAIPLELVEIAEVTAARAYYAKRAGQEDQLGNSQQGQSQVSRYVSGRDRDTLAAFRRKLSLTSGFMSLWQG